MSDKTDTETLGTALSILSQVLSHRGHRGDAEITAKASLRLHDQAEEIERLKAEIAALKDAAHYAKGVAELAIRHRDEAEALVAVARGALVADMFWDDDNPEMAEGSINDVMVAKIESGRLSDGDMFTVQMACRLPNQTFRAIATGDGDYSYEPVDKTEVTYANP